MTLPIARDLSREGIRVNTILPGIFNTPLLAAAPDNVKQALGAQVPYPSRLGNPEEYAKLATTMCEVNYFNGEDVRLTVPSAWLHARSYIQLIRFDQMTAGDLP